MDCRIFLFRKDSVSFLHQECFKKVFLPASSKGKDNSTLNFWPGTIFSIITVSTKTVSWLWPLMLAQNTHHLAGSLTESPGTWAWMTSDIWDSPHRPRPQSSKASCPQGLGWAHPDSPYCRRPSQSTHLCLGLHPAGHALRKGQYSSQMPTDMQASVSQDKLLAPSISTVPALSHSWRKPGPTSGLWYRGYHLSELQSLLL